METLGNMMETHGNMFETIWKRMETCEKRMETCLKQYGNFRKYIETYLSWLFYLFTYNAKCKIIYTVFRFIFFSFDKMF